MPEYMFVFLKFSLFSGDVFASYVFIVNKILFCGLSQLVLVYDFFKNRQGLPTL